MTEKIKVKGKGKDILNLFKRASINGESDLFLQLSTKGQVQSSIHLYGQIMNVLISEANECNITIESDGKASDEVKTFLFMNKELGLKNLMKLLKTLSTSNLNLIMEIEEDKELKHNIVKQIRIETARTGETYILPSYVSDIKSAILSIVYKVNVKKDGTRVINKETTKTPIASYETSIENIKEAIEKYKAFINETSPDITIALSKSGMVFKFGEMGKEQAVIPIDGAYIKEPEEFSTLTVSSMLEDILALYNNDETVILDIFNDMIGIRHYRKDEEDKTITFMHITDIMAKESVSDFIEEEESEEEISEPENAEEEISGDDEEEEEDDEEEEIMEEDEPEEEEDDIAL